MKLLFQVQLLPPLLRHKDVWKGGLEAERNRKSLSLLALVLVTVVCWSAASGFAGDEENVRANDHPEDKASTTTGAASGRYVDVMGLPMYYEIHGAGPPLLLLHGGAGTISEKWIEFLADDYRVIAMEQMGHGRTKDLPDRAFHYHDMAEDTVELMRHLEIDRALVVGYSDGGIIGLDMAIHHPERVQKLAVTGANFHSDGYKPGVLSSALSATPDDWPASDLYRQLSPDGPGHWPVVLKRLQQMWAVEPNFTREQLQGIQAPTLIVIGDRDIVTPEHTVEMFKLIPGSQLCVVPNTGHGAMPRETVLGFLSEKPTGTD